MSIEEESITSTGSVAIYDRPLGPAKKRKYKEFVVPNDVFRRFETGRVKFERWSKYLNLEDAGQKSIYDYYNKTRGKSIIILRNEETGALKAIRARSSNDL